MNQEDQSTLWKNRARLVMQVQAGKLTVTEAAQQLGVSRKTYYEWESRALAAMAAALENGTSGRPANPPEDPEKEAMRQQIDHLKKELTIAEQTVEVRDMLKLVRKPLNKPKSKKKRNIKKKR